MKFKLKLSEVLAAKETSLRTVEKATAEDVSLQPILDGGVWKYTDEIIDLVRPYADEAGCDPEDLECKRIQVSGGVVAVDEEDIDAVQVISTRDMDRDQDIVIPKGCRPEQFNKAPQVLLGHNHGELPVALGPIKSINAKEVRSNVVFAPTDRAQEAKQLVQGGFLRTASVGFLPLKSAWKGSEEFAKLAQRFSKFPEFMGVRDMVTRFVEEWLLLEWSYVSVPANPNALTAAVSKGQIKLSDKWIKDLKIEIPEKKDDGESKPEDKPDEKPEGGEQPPAPEPKRVVEAVRDIQPIEVPTKRFVEPVGNISDEFIEKSVKKTIDIKQGVAL